MVLIVGLGNPGRKFINTRHNVGFRVLDEFLTRNIFPEFKLSKKFNVLISQGILEDNEIILVKPQTFMNESGKAVKKIMSNVKCQMSNVYIVHDDVDLPLGKIKIVKNRGAAGHKGVQSIINELGIPNKSLRDFTGQAKNFIRFRIGIQPKSGKPENVAKFVLKKFSKEEKKILKKVIKKTVKAIEMALKEGVEKMMNQFNQ